MKSSEKNLAMCLKCQGKGRAIVLVDFGFINGKSVGKERKWGNCYACDGSGNDSDSDFFRSVEGKIVTIGRKHFGDSFNADSAFEVGYDVNAMCRALEEIAVHFVVKLPSLQIVRKSIYPTDGTLGTVPFVDGLKQFKVIDLVHCVVRRLRHPEYKWSPLWNGWWQVESA